jgi:molybdopterin biosynthesis enzyme
MPPGADAVVMVEQTDGRSSQSASSRRGTGQNIGRQGADIKTGQTVMRAGEVLNASRVGALAALGLRTSRSTRARASRSSRPATRLSIRPAARPGHIYDINRFTLSRSSPIMAAFPCLTARPPTPSPICPGSR